MLINGPSPWSTTKCREVLFYVQSALPLLVTFFFSQQELKTQQRIHVLYMLLSLISVGSDSHYTGAAETPALLLSCLSFRW